MPVSPNRQIDQNELKRTKPNPVVSDRASTLSPVFKAGFEFCFRFYRDNRLANCREEITPRARRQEKVPASLRIFSQTGRLHPHEEVYVKQPPLEQARSASRSSGSLKSTSASGMHDL